MDEDMTPQGFLTPSAPMLRPGTPEPTTQASFLHTPSPLKPSSQVLRALPADVYFSLLPRLRVLLLQEFENWSLHLKQVQQIYYSQIIVREGIDYESANVKTDALLHVLENLPSRFAALAKANGERELVLSEKNANLLAQLKASPDDVVYEGTHWDIIHDQDAMTEIFEQESELEALEEARMDQLRELRKCFLSVGFEQFKEPEEVVAMMEAMEAIGISVAELLPEGHEIDEQEQMVE